MTRATYFLELDGLILNSDLTLNAANVRYVNSLYDSGSVIILTTYRTESERCELHHRLSSCRFHHLLLDLPSKQVMVQTIQHESLSLLVPKVVDLEETLNDTLV